MNASDDHFDAIVIGGGFYGCVIALYLKRRRGLARVLLVEQEDRLLARASFRNQARVHSGYHYPRSLTTGFRSRVNFPRFLADWPQAATQTLTKLYAIARGNSRVTPGQFERFCREISAPLRPAPPDLRALFVSQRIEAVYLAEETVFNADALRDWAVGELTASGVTLQLSTRAQALKTVPRGYELVLTPQPPGVPTDAQAGFPRKRGSAPYIFNCTYAGLTSIGGDFAGADTPLKHELTEMALLEVPEPLKGLGITVMDGPFFSLMPFPARGLHTLSHVRYTPHQSWHDDGRNPYEALARYSRESRADRMLRDAARYLPLLQQAVHRDSLFEVKTVLVKNEADDGRPILFERHRALPGCYSILGGKIDNIYDVLEKLELERFPAPG